jgi:HSP20 family molecular chaperone IbpA
MGLSIDQTTDQDFFELDIPVELGETVDIDVRIEGNQLSISTEIKKEREDKRNGRMLSAVTSGPNRDVRS